MTRYGIVALIVVSQFTSPLAAQSKLPVAIDQRVRLWTEAAEAVTGRVVAVTPETLQVAQEGRDPVTVAVATVRRVEVSRGGKSKGAGAKKGALWGALIGGTFGAISGGLQHETIGEDGSTVGEAVALGIWSGGLFGALIGAGIGAARGGEKWDQVWP